MNATRQKNESHWRGVGRRAALCGIPFGRVETCNAQVNLWIGAGYGSVRVDAEMADRNRPKRKMIAADIGLSVVKAVQS